NPAIPQLGVCAGLRNCAASCRLYPTTNWDWAHVAKSVHLNTDRLFPTGKKARLVARDLYEGTASLPIVSPHGHVLPQWFADNKPVSDSSSLCLTPDHYVLRMMRSQCLSYDAMGVPRKDGAPVASGRDAWNLFAKNYHLLDATPSRMWFDHALE